MNSPQIASLLFVSASVMAVAILALMGVPYLALLVFRIRLARVRDDTVDAILDQRLRRTAGVDAFLDSLTRAATQVRSAGLLNHCLAALGYQRRCISVPVLLLFRADVADLNPAEREMMRELGTRARHAYQSLLMAASPVGWLIAPAALLTRRFGPVKQPAHARIHASGASGRVAASKAFAGTTRTEWPADEHRSPSSGLVGQDAVVGPDQHPAPAPTAYGPAAAPAPQQANRVSGNVGLPQQIRLAP